MQSPHTAPSSPSFWGAVEHARAQRHRRTPAVPRIVRIPPAPPLLRDHLRSIRALPPSAVRQPAWLVLARTPGVPRLVWLAPEWPPGQRAALVTAEPDGLAL